MREGLSIRKIARRHGCSKSTIHSAIREKYGKDACNPMVNGFARTIAQEYPDMDLTPRTMNIPGYYLTSRKEKNISLHQSTDIPDIYQEEQEEVVWLRLPFVILLFQAVVDILRGLNIEKGYEL